MRLLQPHEYAYIRSHEHKHTAERFKLLKQDSYIWFLHKRPGDGALAEFDSQNELHTTYSVMKTS